MFSSQPLASLPDTIAAGQRAVLPAHLHLVLYPPPPQTVTSRPPAPAGHNATQPAPRLPPPSATARLHLPHFQHPTDPTPSPSTPPGMPAPLVSPAWPPGFHVPPPTPNPSPTGPPMPTTPPPKAPPKPPPTVGELHNVKVRLAVLPRVVHAAPQLCVVNHLPGVLHHKRPLGDVLQGAHAVPPARRHPASRSPDNVSGVHQPSAKQLSVSLEASTAKKVQSVRRGLQRQQ